MRRCLTLRTYAAQAGAPSAVWSQSGCPRIPLGRLRAGQDADRAGHFARPATRLMDAEMMTTPSGYDSQAWRNAMRRICLDSMLVSETWNVMPTVKDR